MKFFLGVSIFLAFAFILHFIIQQAVKLVMSGMSKKPPNLMRFCYLTMEELNQFARRIRPFAGLMDIEFCCNMHIMLQLYILGPDTFPAFRLQQRVTSYDYGLIISGKKFSDWDDGELVLIGLFEELIEFHGSLQNAWEQAKQNSRDIMMAESGLSAGMLDRIDAMTSEEITDLLEATEADPASVVKMLA